MLISDYFSPIVLVEAERAGGVDEHQKTGLGLLGSSTA